MTMQVLIELQDAQGQCQQYTLGPGQYYLGKADSCAIVLNDPHVSRHHATLEVSDNELVFADNNSTNGTWFEEQRLNNPIVLQAGDVLRMGTAVLTILEVTPQEGQTEASSQRLSDHTHEPDSTREALTPDARTGAQGSAHGSVSPFTRSRSQAQVKTQQGADFKESVTYGRDVSATAKRADFASVDGGAIPYVPGTPLDGGHYAEPSREVGPTESSAVKLGGQRVSQHVSQAATSEKETQLTPDQQAEMARYFAQMSDQPMSQPTKAETAGRSKQSASQEPDGQSQLDPEVARARIEGAIRTANPALYDAMSPEDRGMYIKQVTGVAQVMVTEQLRRLEKKVQDAKAIYSQGEGQARPQARRLSVQTLSKISFGELKPLLEDASVSEVIINGLSSVQLVRHGRLEQVQYRFPDHQAIYQLIFKMVGPLGYTPETLPPVLKTPLINGTYLSLIMPPVAAQGPQITLKKTRKLDFRHEHLLQYGACSQAMLQFLSQCLAQHRNIIVTGAPGSGKTACLNVLANMAQPHERIAMIEHTPELTVGLPQVMSLQTAMPQLQGYSDITMAALLETALDLGPDRVVIGDIDPKTTLSAITTMRCNDFGVLGAMKAHSAQDLINQIELNILLDTPQLPLSVVREQIAQAVNIIVTVERVYDGSHKIMQIAEVYGLEDGLVSVHPVFQFTPRGVAPDGIVQGVYEATGYVPNFYQALVKAGASVDTKIFECHSGAAPTGLRAENL